MVLCVETPAIDMHVPVCTYRFAKEDDPEDAPSCGPKDQQEEDVTVVLAGAEVRKDSQILDRESDFNEVDRELVEERL